MKEANEIKSPLNSADIDFNSNINEEINDNENAPQTASKEIILQLPRGYKCWIKLCTFFGISVIIFSSSLPIALNNQPEYPFLFVFVGIGGLGIFISFILLICCSPGFITVNPNEAVVYEYFGRYIGTIKENGYFHGNPFAKTTRISLRSNQYNGNRLKVNERDGNPVELGIIVVWRVGDTAKAVFDVTSYQTFIHTQSESAIRYIGCKYPYEPTVKGEISLRGGHEIINKELKKELESRVKISGIIIEDARVTEISYGQEVAQMMLQKQASNATVYAKDAIVKGSANAVMNSLNGFEQNGCEFTDEQKSKYITSLMTTLCMSSEVSKTIEKN